MKVYTVDPEPLPEGTRYLPAAALEAGIFIRLADKRRQVVEFCSGKPREGWVEIFDGTKWWALPASRHIEVVEFEKEFLNRTTNAFEPKGSARK